MSDIIEQGTTNFRYKVVNDNIFDKVFRGVYQEEIKAFEALEIFKEYKQLYDDIKKKYESLKEKYNAYKGFFAEYVIIRQLIFHAYKKNDFFKSITNNLPKDFNFVKYTHVWTYNTTPEYSRQLHIDVFARAKGEEYSIIGEVKNRDIAPFSLNESESFKSKIEDLVEIERLIKAIGFVFSRKGFTKDSEEYLKEYGISYSSDEKWLDGF